MTIEQRQRYIAQGKVCSTCKRGRPDADGNIACHKPQVLEICGVCDLWKPWEGEGYDARRV